jgi:hypothetical protein
MVGFLDIHDIPARKNTEKIKKKFLVEISIWQFRIDISLVENYNEAQIMSNKRYRFEVA